MKQGVLDNERFDKFYNQYIDRLTRVVVHHLWQGQNGPDTVIQEVLLSYFGHIRHDPAVTRDDELWRLLFRIALRHCNNANHRTARWRKATGVRALFRDSRLIGDPSGGFDPVDPGPDFLTEVDGEDWISWFFDRLTPFEREVIKLRLAGHTILEIAGSIGATEVRVRGTLDLIRDLLRESTNQEVGNGIGPA